VAYLLGREPQSFVSLSDDKNKKSDAIAAHLRPVLEHFVAVSNETIERVTVVSDSPTSQYRNRMTLYLIDRLLRKQNILRWQWLYSEAGHGKGAADGVGAALKRRCDEVVDLGLMDAVATAEDVLKASEVPTKLKIKTFLVTSDNIAEFTQVLQTVSLDDMPGIASAHEVCRTASGVVYRELACLCNDATDDCKCHNMRYWRVRSIPVRRDAEQQSVGGAYGGGPVRGRRRGRTQGRGRGRGAVSTAGIQTNPAVSITFQ
jgi:hypothetical protein